MPEFKLNISHNGKSYNKQLDTAAFKGKKIGDIITGDSIELQGYELLITGGSDKEGFPMRPDLKTVGRRKILIVKGVGIRKHRKGIKRRKTVIGNQISLNTRQINLKVTKQGSNKLEEIFGKKEEGAENKEAPKPEVKEDKKVEEKPKEETKVEGKKEEVKAEDKKEEKNETKS